MAAMAWEEAMAVMAVTVIMEWAEAMVEVMVEVMEAMAVTWAAMAVMAATVEVLAVAMDLEDGNIRKRTTRKNHLKRDTLAADMEEVTEWAAMAEAMAEAMVEAMAVTVATAWAALAETMAVMAEVMAEAMAEVMAWEVSAVVMEVTVASAWEASPVVASAFAERSAINGKGMLDRAGTKNARSVEGAVPGGSGSLLHFIVSKLGT